MAENRTNRTKRVRRDEAARRAALRVQAAVLANLAAVRQVTAA